MLPSALSFQPTRHKLSGRLGKLWDDGTSQACLPWEAGQLSRTVGQAGTRFVVEANIEWPLLKKRWKTVVFCLLMQYVHGIFTQLAARFHVATPEPLRDAGFMLTPELGPRHFWISESLFTVLFGSFLVWIVSPFFSERKHFHTVVLGKRVLVHLVCCQMLRCASFMSTMLPGPAHHCHLGEPSAHREWVTHWWQHLIVDVGRQSGRSCGDLIFSSHTTFILAFVLCYTYHARGLVLKLVAWALALVLSVLIIASRKHYTVDVVVAWYTVPLVFLALERRWTTVRTSDERLERLPLDLEAGGGPGSPLRVPLSPMLESIVVAPNRASHAEGLDRAVNAGLDAVTASESQMTQRSSMLNVHSLVPPNGKTAEERMSRIASTNNLQQSAAPAHGRVTRLQVEAAHRRQPSRDSTALQDFSNDVVDDIKSLPPLCRMQ